MNVMELKNVSVRYKSNYNSIMAVDHVSFNVVDGDYLCVVGENGSGKSSLVKAIAGINEVSCGTIKLNIDRSDISYLSQAIEIPQDFPATVKEVVMCGTQNNKFFPFYKKKDHEIASSSIKLLEIEDLKNRRFGELSGGQQQRVLLARAICKHPKVMILDEPFAGLDSKIYSSLCKILKTFNSKMNVTIIMVTHDQSDVEKYASHVVEMNRSLLFYGTVDKWISKRKCGE